MQCSSAMDALGSFPDFNFFCGCFLHEKTNIFEKNSYFCSK